MGLEISFGVVYICIIYCMVPWQLKSGNPNPSPHSYDLVGFELSDLSCLLTQLYDNGSLIIMTTIGTIKYQQTQNNYFHYITQMKTNIILLYFIQYMHVRTLVIIRFFLNQSCLPLFNRYQYTYMGTVINIYYTILLYNICYYQGANNSYHIIIICTHKLHRCINNKIYYIHIYTIHSIFIFIIIIILYYHRTIRLIALSLFSLVH